MAETAAFYQIQKNDADRRDREIEKQERVARPHVDAAQQYQIVGDESGNEGQR